MYRLRWVALLALLLATPLAAQVPDTVVVYVIGRARAANVACPSYGFVGDTLSCRIWATDSAGARTLATFTVTSSAPTVIQPLGVVNDTILRLRLLARGSSSIIVTATAPTAAVIGGILLNEGLGTQRYQAGSIDFAGAVGVQVQHRLCAYLMAGADTVGRSWPTCPGRAPVVPFTWSEAPTQLRQASALIRQQRRGA